MLLTSVGWVNGYYQDGYQDLADYRMNGESPGERSNTRRVSEQENILNPVVIPCRMIVPWMHIRPPDPERPELYEDAERTLRDFRDEYWIVGVTPTTIFECAWALRGYEQLLIDMATDPGRANCVLDFPFRYHMAVTQRLVQMGVDMIWLGDDVGGQTSMLMSPKMWRSYLKPRMAELIGSLRAINPQIKIAYHTDGVVYPIIPELIEIGIDVLNPIQPLAMDPIKLKNDHGDTTVFLGIHGYPAHDPIRYAGRCEG